MDDKNLEPYGKIIDEFKNLVQENNETKIDIFLNYAKTKTGNLFNELSKIIDDKKRIDKMGLEKIRQIERIQS